MNVDKNNFDVHTKKDLEIKDKGKHVHRVKSI